ncbi:hypothetical protein VNI00_011593 [Paramarasmius palmivorus]|uniref:Uncharacterized protein n=1 Tax=Paramarasmius palmivorus TaxID=297713 RepID=A0AAW0CD77_9AGAR
MTPNCNIPAYSRCMPFQLVLNNLISSKTIRPPTSAFTETLFKSTQNPADWLRIALAHALYILACKPLHADKNRTASKATSSMRRARSSAFRAKERPRLEEISLSLNAAAGDTSELRSGDTNSPYLLSPLKASSFKDQLLCAWSIAPENHKAVGGISVLYDGLYGRYQLEWDITDPGRAAKFALFLSKIKNKAVKVDIKAGLEKM